MRTHSKPFDACVCEFVYKQHHAVWTEFFFIANTFFSSFFLQIARSYGGVLLLLLYIHVCVVEHRMKKKCISFWSLHDWPSETSGVVSLSGSICFVSFYMWHATQYYYYFRLHTNLFLFFRSIVAFSSLSLFSLLAIVHPLARSPNNKRMLLSFCIHDFFCVCCFNCERRKKNEKMNKIKLLEAVQPHSDWRKYSHKNHFFLRQTQCIVKYVHKWWRNGGVQESWTFSSCKSIYMSAAKYRPYSQYFSRSPYVGCSAKCRNYFKWNYILNGKCVAFYLSMNISFGSHVRSEMHSIILITRFKSIDLVIKREHFQRFLCNQKQNDERAREKVTRFWYTKCVCVYKSRVCWDVTFSLSGGWNA